MSFPITSATNINFGRHCKLSTVNCTIAWELQYFHGTLHSRDYLSTMNDKCTLWSCELPTSQNIAKVAKTFQCHFCVQVFLLTTGKEVVGSYRIWQHRQFKHICPYWVILRVIPIKSQQVVWVSQWLTRQGNDRTWPSTLILHQKCATYFTTFAIASDIQF